MTNEIYLNSLWGNPTPSWGNIYYQYSEMKLQFNLRVIENGGIVESLECVTF